METVLLLVLAVFLGLDVLSNLFMIIFYPKWSSIRREEIDALREHASELKRQNEELKEYIRGML